MRLNIKALAACAVLGATFSVVNALSAPADASGFTLLGGSLGVGQRDFRVFNNFSDAAANNNQTPNSNFPGAQGAVMSIWKAHVEWGSETWAGNGSGDPLQSLGNGGANFDNTYQGIAPSIGGSNSNVHAELNDNNPGGTLAFMQGPISDGWIIRYLSFWEWKDGPGGVNSTPGGTGYDIQNIATHEIGHALGLDHSQFSSATMWASAAPGSETGRSISSDDQAGVQAVYGVKTASKPTITGISGQTGPGGVLTITGNNFEPTGNTIWFTKENNTDGISLRVNDVASTSGGTVINVTVPAGAIDGEVQVKVPLTGNASLSNAWPIDIGTPVTDAPLITGATPSNGPLAGGTQVVIDGTGFNGTNSVTFGGVAAAFVVDNNTQITATSPAAGAPGAVDIVVTDPDGSDTLNNGFTYDPNPIPSIGSLFPVDNGPTTGGTIVTIFGSDMDLVNSVTFGGAAATINITAPGSVNVTTPPGFGAVDIVVANPFGSDTLVDGWTYTGGGSFVNIGPGLGGSLGVPVFTGTGDLTPGSAVGYSTTLSNVPAGVQAFLFLSLTESAVPFKGGTFYPFPIIASFNLFVPGSGTVVLPAAMDNSVPNGLEIIAQWWMADATGPLGATGSNGLKLVVP